MNDKDQLWKLKRYYEKVLIDYYSTDEIDPDMANRIVGGLTRFMNITEQQQHEIEHLQDELAR
jgi:predicted nucleic acid-binding protein